MRRLMVGVVVGGCLTVGLAAPSQAQVVRIDDGRDTAAVQELLAVRVNHVGRVVVTLKYSSSYALHAEFPFTIDFDTKRARPGAEFTFPSHFSGVYTVRHGQADQQVQCSIRYRQDNAKHTMRLSFAHRCLRGDTGPVRIKVAATAKSAAGQRTITDYAPGRHRWSAPVRQG